MEDIVTIRANRDCYFQIFLSSGKILQFKAQTMESQACWMAMLKVGLGRGTTLSEFSTNAGPPGSSLAWPDPIPHRGKGSGIWP